MTRRWTVANRYCQLCGGFHELTTAPCPSFTWNRPLDVRFNAPLTGSSALAARIAELEAALATAVKARDEAQATADLVMDASEERQRAERERGAGRALYGELAVIYRRLTMLSDAHSRETAATLDGLLQAYETAAATHGEDGEGEGAEDVAKLRNFATSTAEDGEGVGG